MDWRRLDRERLEARRTALLAQFEAARAAESRARTARAQIDSALVAVQRDLRQLDQRTARQAAR